ncbi:MAG: hypothetical protein HIU92_18285 [Proteobacteria bacterium]|nr:hypothetical protein [Pseudomonadota bacterium]
MRPDRASLRRIEDGYDLPPGMAGGSAEPDAPEAVPDLDDRTLAYVLAARDPFEGLRRAASQLAGLLVLAAIGSREAQGNPMLDMAIAAHREAVERLRALTPPARATHHHHHLSLAAEALGEALTTTRHSLRLTETVNGVIDGRLRQALEDLRWASRALPGFELVNFSQGCCAMHGGPLSPKNNKTLQMRSREEGS